MDTYRKTISLERRKQETTAALKRALRGVPKRVRREAFERAAAGRMGDAAPL